MISNPFKKKVDGSQAGGDPNAGAIMAVGLGSGDAQAAPPAAHSRASQEPFEVRRAHARKENIHQCISIVIFICFVITFTVSVVLEQSAVSARLADHVRYKLENGLVPISSIRTVHDVYTYIESSFIPALWVNNTDTRLAKEVSRSLLPVDTANYLLGSARMRQVRVKQEDNCQVNPMFDIYRIPCYPGFSEGKEDADEFGDEGMMFKYSDDSDGTKYTGYMSTYPSGGFMQTLSWNHTKALLTLKTLKEKKFLGLATRAVFLDFSLWSSNVGKYAVMRLVVEFTPAGTVHTFLQTLILSEANLVPGGLGETNDWLQLVSVFFVILFVFWYMAEEAQEFFHSRLAYLMDAWNIIDWVNMVLLIVCFFMRVVLFSKGSGMDIGEKQIKNKETFTSLMSLAELAEMVRLLNAFNAVMIWGKMVKYLRYLPIVRMLVRTVWDAFKSFLPFLAMFSIAFIGFTMSYNTGFGDKIQELTTFPRAFVYLSRAYLRDVKLMPAYHITPLFGALLILLFYVCLVMVGLNVLFAILADSLYHAKYTKKDENKEALHEDEPLEEVARIVSEKVMRVLREKSPRLFVKLRALRDNSSKEGNVGPAPDAIMDQHPGNFDKYSSTGSMSTISQERRPSTEELMRAIGHMSGRVLSEVQEVGIEIKAELHDVCERVAQMQMAVEELSWRAEKVRLEQVSVMDVS